MFQLSGFHCRWFRGSSAPQRIQALVSGLRVPLSQNCLVPVLYTEVCFEVTVAPWQAIALRCKQQPSMDREVDARQQSRFQSSGLITQG